MSKQQGRNPGPIPQRWLHCPRKSLTLIADKFLAFKTPLSSVYNDQVPMESRFEPKFVFNSMKSYKLKIGLWIDLTNTSRFYDKKEVEENGCKYLKLQCQGHDGAPTQDQTRAFINVCEQFITHHPLELIGVHCTHGFNRSGFLIVSYLVEFMDCSVEVAISQFAKARPPGIYKKDYLHELFKRYDDENYTPEPPELPDWCKEYDDSKDDDNNSLEEIISTEDGASSSGKRRGKEFKNKCPKFMEGVSGVSVVSNQAKVTEIQRLVQDLCGWKKSGFPGSQPVSMDTTNVNFLHEKPYRVSWKADGTRYMMFIRQKNEVYFIDRDNCIFQVAGLKFPHRKDLNKHVTNTLLDGEMVIDKVDGHNIPRYLAYDIIKFEGQDVGKTAFYPVRLGCIEKEIVQPRLQAMKERRIDRTAEPFSIRPKQFWDVTQASGLLSEKFSKNLAHEPDGLIFQPSQEPYVAGRCSEVLKWKPVSLNSVDFKLKIVTELGEGILRRKVGHLYVGGMDRPFAQMKVSKAVKELDNKIIECKFHDNQWIFMRERTDKSFPNSFATATGVCNSIRDPVTTESLLDFIEHHRWMAKDQDLMPPPSKRQKREPIEQF